jgi:very-short-patch-repair endonuclease
MTKHYNKSSEKEKRRKLRQNQTNAEELVWRYLRNKQMLGYKFKRQPACRQAGTPSITLLLIFIVLN